MKKYEIKLDRRNFLKKSTMVGLASIAPGVFFQELVHARPLDEPASNKIRWGMLIDTNQCTEDCDACVTACNDEHGIEDFGRPATDTQWIRKLNLTDEFSGDKLNYTKWSTSYKDLGWYGRPPGLFLPSNVVVKSSRIFFF